MADYVFGYGSLISTESRLKSGETGECAPVRVNNLKREFNLPVPTYCDGRGIIGLGVAESRLDSCNGVLFRCNDIDDYRKREEKYCYQQKLLGRTDLIFLNQGLSLEPRDNLWYFSPVILGRPSKRTPIRQSYLDVILTGCLEYNENFAREFVRTTHTWLYWLNDRKNPAYEHPVSNVDFALIDEILRQELEEDFNRIDE